MPLGVGDGRVAGEEPAVLADAALPLLRVPLRLVRLRLRLPRTVRRLLGELRKCAVFEWTALRFVTFQGMIGVASFI